ncbi:GHKL domain-containing protein [Serpentinicella sp. ANB-PHB4]|uniref:sensor histidine kinase n=1 Tax=Serpentinicella sp. ANB-PHB4 TaxID=3074076 RepID=UPI002862D52C|nr:GHKL domain-containing protein [Serpentinicella sp. ANB-PHB4]MDR5658811.1 GHKL domain-containing protein [Serpentinicella sp. ANB-PHB4]
MIRLKNTGKYILIFTILFQTILILMLNTSIRMADSLDSLKNNIFIYNILIISITILVIISLARVGEYEAKQTELNLVKTNMKAVEELITLLKTERHDYVSHIQSINALLYLQEYEELSNYITGISKEYRTTNQIIRVGHPVLTAILNTKREVAQEKGINFEINCKEKIDKIKLNSWELNNLATNLIENAIEAAILMPKDERWINITLGHCKRGYSIQIENPGCISNNIQKALFEAGISTKDVKTRGYGLHICKKIMDKYNGSINVENTARKTVVFTAILPRGE